MLGEYSIILGNVGSCGDRYCTNYEDRKYSLEELVRRAASINMVKAVEMNDGPFEEGKKLSNIKLLLEGHGLKLSSITPDHFLMPVWGKGSFSSKDKNIRKLAVDRTKVAIDIALELGCDLINLWPGQDGFDYLFQTDYEEDMVGFIEGIKECCRYKKNARIALEYKLKEPRTHSYVNNVSTALLMAKEVGEDNCGVTIDYGHALIGYENPSHSAALLRLFGDKLFHIHMNDNFRYWDDDMIAGSVHTLEYIEFFHWLNRTGYQGWISMDQFPYREDGRDAVNESVQWVYKLQEKANELDYARINEVYKTGSAVEASRFMRSILFN